VRRLLAADVCLALATPLLLLSPPASAATPARPYDFDGDGYPELAVSAPGLPVGTHPGAGGVFVLPASKTGVASRGARLVTAASPGVFGTPHDDEGFGDSLASGDFDGDGFADLAIGRLVTDDGGAVTVVYGSAKGLTGARSLELVEPGVGHTYGSFGVTLAAGDFDGDGRTDLAAGMPYSPEPGGQGFGEVALFRGSTTGLSQSRSSLLHGVGGAHEDVYFGSTLAVGDLDSDGRTDLVVGSTGSFGDDVPTGSVGACYGVARGPTTCTQLAYDAALSDSRAMVVGNVSGTSRPEILLSVSDDESHGAVQVLSLTGPRASTTVSRVELTEDSPGVPGTAEHGDDFGADLALGDLDHDGFADLVVGAPGEDEGAGQVIVVHGGAAGLRATGGRIYAQGRDGVPGKAEELDRFGESLSLVDHDRDTHPDLTVGAPRENDDSGAITIIDGAGTGFTTRGSRTFGLGLLADPTDGAAFGTPIGR
jgi:hypothetical protein